VDLVVEEDRQNRCDPRADDDADQPVKPSIDLREAAVDLDKTALDLCEAAVDLDKASINLGKTRVHLIEALIDRIEATVNAAEPFTDLLNDPLEMSHASFERMGCMFLPPRYITGLNHAPWVVQLTMEEDRQGRRNLRRHHRYPRHYDQSDKPAELPIDFIKSERNRVLKRVEATVKAG
jgi:hypothetical protein